MEALPMLCERAYVNKRHVICGTRLCIVLEVWATGAAFDTKHHNSSPRMYADWLTVLQHLATPAASRLMRMSTQTAAFDASRHY